MEKIEAFKNNNEGVPDELKIFLNKITEDFSSIPRKRHIIAEEPEYIGKEKFGTALYFAEIEGEYARLKDIVDTLIANSLHNQLDYSKLSEWKNIIDKNKL